MKAISIKIDTELNGTKGAIYPVVLEHNNTLFLVDCGFPGMLDRIEAAIKKMSLSLNNFTGIIITHFDIDHIGSLSDVKTRYPHLVVYASEIEARFISGAEQPFRLKQALAWLDTVSAQQRPAISYFVSLLTNLEPVEVNYILKNNEDLPGINGLRIIETPGHTPGHISIYLPGSKILIAGDSLVVENDILGLANPGSAFDLIMAVNSVKRFLELDIDKIICYHGGEVSGQINQKLVQLMNNFPG
jgi:glyoxylase-like metal-dependent hydrolase (beta-lactamase superfamily II)